MNELGFSHFGKNTLCALNNVDEEGIATARKKLLNLTNNRQDMKGGGNNL